MNFVSVCAPVSPTCRHRWPRPAPPGPARWFASSAPAGRQWWPRSARRSRPRRTRHPPAHSSCPVIYVVKAAVALLLYSELNLVVRVLDFVECGVPVQREVLLHVARVSIRLPEVGVGSLWPHRLVRNCTVESAKLHCNTMLYDWADLWTWSLRHSPISEKVRGSVRTTPAERKSILQIAHKHQ